MAGAGFKTFSAGAVLTAAEVNTYLMQQSVMVFGGTAARSSAIPTPSEGMVTYLSDLNDIQAYNGSSWISTGLTAGTTTANYGWPIPASGSIASLGTAIDTTVSGLGSGLKLITTSSFTTQSSVSFNNVFSSTYRNYKVILNVKGSTGNTLQSRMRLNGTDNTTASSYGSQYISARATTVSGAKVTLDNFRTAYLSATTNSIQVMEIGNPNVAEATSFQVFNTYFGSSFAVTDVNIWFGYHDQSTAYDGITFSVDTGTFTGTLEIYGYQK